MSAGLPRWLALGAATLCGVGLVAWVVRGPAILLDLMWLGCL